MTARDEEMHRILYAAHADLRAGGDRIHTALVMLASDCRYEESRKKFSGVAQLLSEARDHADKALTVAGTARTEIIRNTGCDNSCDRAATKGEQ